MSKVDSLFDRIQNVGTDLEEMCKAQSEYLLKAANSHFEMQKRHSELAAQILQNHVEYYTAWLADLQENLSQNGLHRFIPTAQEKPKKAA